MTRSLKKGPFVDHHLLAKVERGGAFSVRTRIPPVKRTGRYTVTARCGGGNLGILEHLTVRR